MMSQCRVPNWNLRHQSQGQEEAEEGNKSSQIHNHNHNQHNPTHVFPMSNYEVAELTWENGQLAMHGLLSTTPTKPTWGRACDTLESIVHQGTCTKESLNFLQNDRNSPNISSGIAFASFRDRCSGDHVQKSLASFEKKRTRSDFDQWGRIFSTTMQEERAADRSACGSATATFCRDNENNTMMTWASFESPPSLKTKTTDEDSACHGGSENQDEDRETKGETGRSHSTRRSRAAAIHNQSERRRRDRINQKMKALQKLVPNASKTDKASMLDEVIEYLKQLQAQVHMMSSVRNMQPQMMMPLGMQQQIQMSLLARMGMGLGMGMGMGQSLSPLVHPNPATASTFVQPPTFMVPPSMVSQVPQPNSDAATRTSVPNPFNDPYCAFLAQQSMNMDLYNKMAVLYRQQVNQTSPSAQSNHVQGD